MTLEDLMTLAAVNANTGTLRSSAQLRLADAVALAARGEAMMARKAALDSLRFSLGVLHPDFRRAVES